MNDAYAEDQAVLDAIAKDGHDLSQPMPIDFFLVAPDEPAAHKMAEALRAQSFSAEIEYDDGEGHEHDGQDPQEDSEDAEEEPLGPTWAVCVSIDMLPEVKELIRLQVQLAELVEPFEGVGAGWGTVGNLPVEVEEEEAGPA